MDNQLHISRGLYELFCDRIPQDREAEYGEISEMSTQDIFSLVVAVERGQILLPAMIVPSEWKSFTPEELECEAITIHDTDDFDIKQKRILDLLEKSPTGEILFCRMDFIDAGSRRGHGEANA